MKLGKQLLYVITLLFLIVATGCITQPEARPTEVEQVTYDELADKTLMQDNSNRLVQVTVTYLGPDVAVMPQQALYSDIADKIMINHCKPGFDYTERMVSSTGSFLMGFPATDEYTELVDEKLEIGDTITVTGLTEYVNAGFGMFQHLLLNVEKVEIEEAT